MKCSDIQEKLMAYLEGTISSEDNTLVEEHLKVCSKCRESMADVRKTIGYVRNLDEIEPPAWLTQKVMARVRDEGVPKRGMIQTLFYPLHIKLPIEALAAIFVAVISIYVFKVAQPEMQLAKAPSEEVLPQFLSQEARPDQDMDKKSSFPAKPEKRFPLPEKKEVQLGESVAPGPRPAQRAQRDALQRPAGTITEYEAKSKVGSPEWRGRTSAARKREGISLTSHATDIEIASREIEKTILQFEGTMIETATVQNTIVIGVELDVKNVKAFIEELRDVGTITETTTVSTVQEREPEPGETIITIAILPQRTKSH
jgi:hypothetical protein